MAEGRSKCRDTIDDQDLVGVPLSKAVVLGELRTEAAGVSDSQSPGNRRVARQVMDSGTRARAAVRGSAAWEYW